MRRALAVLALAGIIACGSAGVVAVGQPPEKTEFDFSDDIAKLRGERPKESDLLSGLKGPKRSASGATTPDSGTLADEFNASLARIRAQEADLEAQAEAQRIAQAEANRIAAIQAEQDRQAQQTASHVQSLRASCDRAYDRCENRCDGASNSAILGAFADGLSGRTSSSPMPSYSSCARQCRNEQTQCQSAASAGDNYKQTFKGPSASTSSASGMSGGGMSFGQSGGIDTPQCKAAEAEAKRAMSGLGRGGAGICQPARESIKMYQAGLRYLQLCPAADPTGEQRRMYEANLAQSREVERSSCN